MGIFGDDKLQDERIAALEEHVRVLTQTVQFGQRVSLCTSATTVRSMHSMKSNGFPMMWSWLSSYK